MTPSEAKMRQEFEADLDAMAKKMGDAGYCNYAACREYLKEFALLTARKCAEIAETTSGCLESAEDILKAYGLEE